MRVWLSIPVIKGIRTGVSVNPNSFFITRKLPWFQCLSGAGKKVWFKGAAVIACGMVLWAIVERDRLDTIWPAMFILLLIALWILKRTTLALFPRQFTETDEPAAQHPEQRYNSFGEEIETPTLPMGDAVQRAISPAPRSSAIARFDLARFDFPGLAFASGLALARRIYAAVNKRRTA
jgi:hypothetical protein